MQQYNSPLERLHRPLWPPRWAHAEFLIALLNAVLMWGGNWVWRWSILLSIFTVYLKPHADDNHEFCSDWCSRSSRAKIWLFPLRSRRAGGGYMVCVYLPVCVRAPCGFLWCYRGNWMCDAHQKSPLALGKCSRNPSMPLWNPESGFFQLADIKWFPVLRLLLLCSSIRARASNAAVEGPDEFLITDC